STSPAGGSACPDLPRGRAEAPSAPGFTRSKAGQSLHRPPVSNGRQGAGPPPGCSTDVDRGDHVTRLLRAHARARALVRHALGRRRPAVHGPVFRAAALLTGLAAATTALAATTARAAAAEKAPARRSAPVKAVLARTAAPSPVLRSLLTRPGPGRNRDRAPLLPAGHAPPPGASPPPATGHPPDTGPDDAGPSPSAAPPDSAPATGDSTTGDSTTG